ncbi:MAG: PilZ domain-containing protein [Treponema sp.]|nr:PilZ domain-containing protein [Treponema sp.]
MGIATNQQIANYYESYQSTEIIFSKEVLKTLHINPREIYIKCNGSQWPCIINSMSFTMAKIIIGTNGGAFAQITEEENATVSVRLCFVENGKTTLSFFISGHVSEITPYMDSTQLSIVKISFKQRPPDDFISKIGELIEANQNFLKRKEERVTVSKETQHQLGLEKTEGILIIDEKPTKCILRDLSFSGVKVLLASTPEKLLDKNVILALQFTDSMEPTKLEGAIVGASSIEGMQGITSANIHFVQETISMEYKIHINNYITATRKNILENSNKSPKNNLTE